MTNTNIQGAVQLNGPGFVARRKGNFKPGEYMRLVNAELDRDGAVVNRRNIVNVGGLANATSFGSCFPIIGTHDDGIIVASATVHRYLPPNTAPVTLWAPTALPVPVGGWHKIMGYFQYNKTSYWLTCDFDPNAAGGLTQYRFYIYSIATPFNGLNTIAFASLTKTTIISATFATPIMTSFFIHKERLFISTADSLYFSAATNPLDFTVPNGGFINFPNKTIKHAFSLSDTIYILCNSSVHVYTYSTDPNNDAYLRTIIDNMGGDWGCVHKSTPYIINNTGIYAISNGNVSKIHDAQFDVGDDAYQHKILSFEDYLVVIRRQSINYDGIASSDAQYFNKESKAFTPGLSNNTLGYNVFFINTELGSTHVVDFTECNEVANKGYIVDAIFNPVKDFYGNYKLYFMTNKYLSTNGAATTYVSSWYYMDLKRGVFCKDVSRDYSNVLRAYKPRICVEIDSYSPDGMEYLIKKFRNLLMEAKFPKADFGVEIAFDNDPYPVNGYDPLPNENFPNQRPYFPARVAINQRARTISIKLRTNNDFVPLADVNTVYDQFELSDMRVLYTYTGRGPELTTLTLANQS